MILKYVGKAFACLMAFFFLLGITATGFGEVNYPPSYYWDFQNKCYMTFNQATNLTNAPDQSLSSLVGYWNMNEGSGTVISDESGNGNNGTISVPNWVTGKFGDALMFNGDDYVNVTYSPFFDFGAGALTCSVWVKYSPQPTSGEHIILRRDGAAPRSFYGFNIVGQTNVLFEMYDSQIIGGFSAQYKTTPSIDCSDGQWHFIVGVRNGDTLSLYKDGSLVGSTSGVASHNFLGISNKLVLGQYVNGGGGNYIGAEDAVCFFNQALTASEITALYTQPDPLSLANYYNYQDSVTNNTLLVHIDSPNANTNNTVLVTCTNFFSGNRLDFQANNSATLNIWTNLGQAPFITHGVWNSENHTTTLTLDTSSTGKLDWNIGTPPSASNLSTSLTTAGKTATFSTLWADNQSLSGGGYIFSTNNTGQWINASWNPFNSTPNWGNATLTLNSAVGTIVGFTEYANNSLNLWGNSGIYTITTTVSTDTSTPTPSSIPTPIPSATPTASPTSTQTLTPTQTNMFPTETILIAATAIGVLVAVFALAFKKGYIKVEVVDEEDSEEKDEDFSI